MAEETSSLAQNIRFLRKQNKLSQQKLAAALGIKRSNIAAYETKNVEPRLSLISKMADFFRVSLADLITKDIEQLSSQELGLSTGPPDFPKKEAQMVEQFSLRVEEMRKLLEGFQVFYQYRQATMQQHPTVSKMPSNDIENFLVFIDQVIDYNEEIFDFLYAHGLSEERTPEATDISLAS